MVDMAGAVLDVALAKIMEDQEDVLAVKATFGTEKQPIAGTFLIMPTMDFMKIDLEPAEMR
jgi:chemotaxis protein CheY-P-specific phosphatase CheC